MNDELKLLKAAKNVADSLELSMSVENESFIFQNRYEDTVEVQPDMYSIQGDEWLLDSLKELASDL